MISMIRGNEEMYTQKTPHTYTQFKTFFFVVFEPKIPRQGKTIES